MPRAAALPDRTRWLAFSVLCVATLMNVLDTTIVNIALDPIRDSLGFSDAGLAWVINAYMLTFGGFLLLAGRLGDLFGPRRLFVGGLALFTLASLACGVAQDPATLIVARAAQGLGAALVTAVSLGLIMSLFPDGPDRVKAMGVFAFVASGGGAIGAALGGFITANFDWHWNFLINIPIGVAVYAGTRAWVPDQPGVATGRIDYAGAVTVTGGMLLAVYAVLGLKDNGWASLETLVPAAAGAMLLVAFVVLERTVARPLVPLSLFSRPNLRSSNIIAALWAAAMFAWFFMASLYMQGVLGYDPQEAGLAFLPANLLMALFSVWLSAKVVMRFGVRAPISAGLAVAAAGLALFAMAPVDGSFMTAVLPGMLLLGIGAGMAFNPLFLAAMSDARPDEAGLASGLLNTSFMLGGSVGLAALATLAASRTAATASGGLTALHAGYQAAFLAGCVCALAAAGLALTLRVKAPSGRAMATAHA